jgi:hypothetical protein
MSQSAPDLEPVKHDQAYADELVAHEMAIKNGGGKRARLRVRNGHVPMGRAREQGPEQGHPVDCGRRNHAIAHCTLLAGEALSTNRQCGRFAIALLAQGRRCLLLPARACTH